MTSIELTKIKTDGGTQMRAEINNDIVSDYRDLWNDRAKFPELIVFHDGKDFWLADGFHRYWGAKEAGRKSVPCDVRQGTLRDAILFAAGANVDHGLRRTNADKRTAVHVLLTDDEWTKKSNRWIAERCGVSHSLVNDYRTQLESNGTIQVEDSSTSREAKDGKKQPAKKPKAESNGAAQAPSQPPQTGPASADLTEEEHVEPCPNCKHDTWIEDTDGWCCEKCKHPLGEPAGDPDKHTPKPKKEIPKALEPVFESATEFRGIVNAIGALLTRCETLSKSPGGERLPMSEVRTEFKNAQEAVKVGMPHAVCPYCKGKKCKQCDQLGWMHKDRYDGIPKERR